jgi:hypothetical protein
LPYARRRALLAELGLDDAVTKTPPYWADHARGGLRPDRDPSEVVIDPPDGQH